MNNQDMLWMKFSQDSNIPERLSLESQKQILIDFNEIDSNSLIYKAFQKVGIRCDSDTNVIQFIDSVAYINWSWFVIRITKNVMNISREGDVFNYTTNKNIINVIKLFIYFMKINKLANDTIDKINDINLDQTPQEELRVDSIVLGLCIQILTLSLPKHTEQEMANWLSGKEKCPDSVRLMIMCQRARTKISFVWIHYYLEDTKNDSEINLPDYFWNQYEFSRNTLATEQAQKPVIVVQGSGEFNVYYIDINRNKPNEIESHNKPRLLVFKNANPKAVEYYEHADAILFLTGGTLAHACVVARERNLTCIIWNSEKLSKKLVKKLNMNQNEIHILE